MVHDITAATRFQERLADLQLLFEQAQAKAPSHADGTDSTGAVRVTTGSGGLPESITVAADWKKRLDPARVGPAVEQAHQNALKERMATWGAALRRSRWHEDFDEVRSGSRRLTRTTPPAPVLPTSGLPPRPLDQLTEAVLGVMRSGEPVEPAAPAQGIGTAGGGRLTITVGASGAFTCTADAQWTVRQSGVMVSTAANSALALACAELTAAMAAAASREKDASAGLTGLLHEAFAHLTR
jgi:hypothetical protein